MVKKHPASVIGLIILLTLLFSIPDRKSVRAAGNYPAVQVAIKTMPDTDCLGVSVPVVVEYGWDYFTSLTLPPADQRSGIVSVASSSGTVEPPSRAATINHSFAGFTYTPTLRGDNRIVASLKYGGSDRYTGESQPGIIKVIPCVFSFSFKALIDKWQPDSWSWHTFEGDGIIHFSSQGNVIDPNIVTTWKFAEGFVTKEGMACELPEMTSKSLLHITGGLGKTDAFLHLKFKFDPLTVAAEKFQCTPKPMQPIITELPSKDPGPYLPSEWAVSLSEISRMTKPYASIGEARFYLEPLSDPAQ